MTLSQPYPQKRELKRIVSYRRLWLDFYLEQFSPEMRGIVIDLGGKKKNKRGSFRPPETQVIDWWYLNLEMSTHPDVFSDVTLAPLASQCADVVICTEVLEHLENPAVCVNEISRLLRPGGRAFISVPFLYPIHADPYDFQRFTADGISHLFRQFSFVNVKPMGGYLGVLGMFIGIGIPGINGQSFQKKFLRRSLNWLAQTLYSLDLSNPKLANPVWDKFTTGYFLKAVK